MSQLRFFLIAVFVLTLIAPAFGQSVPQVVAVWGDPGETTCLAPANDALWIGTFGGGIARWTPDETQMVDSSDGLPGQRVNDCLMHGGDVWVATDAGLAAIDPATRRVDTRLKGRFLRLADAGPALLATRDDGALVRVDATGHQIAKLDFVPTAVAADEAGQWIAGGFDGRVVFGHERTTIRLRAPVTAIERRDGEWLAKTAEGFFAIDPQTGTARAMADSSSSAPPAPIAGSLIHATAQWRGETYFATDDGAWRIESNGASELDLGGMPCGDRISALAAFDEALWVGSFDRGLCRWKDNAWTHWSGPGRLPSDMINDLDADDEHLYVATVLGLAIVDRDENFRSYTADQCQPNPYRNCPWYNSVTGVSVDRETGAVWMSDTGALHRIDTPKWEHYNHRRGVRSERVSGVAASGGLVAASTGDLGVHWRNSGRDFATIDEQQGVADNWVMRVEYDDAGRLYAATCTRGLSIFDGTTWRTITQDDGLIDDYTLSVRPIDESLWVGTLSGLTIFDEKGAVSLTTEDGLPGNEVHDILLWRDCVYVATDGGVAVVAR